MAGDRSLPTRGLLLGTRLLLGDDALDVRFCAIIVVDVEVPGIDVGIDMSIGCKMFPEDYAHVLDQAGVV